MKFDATDNLCVNTLRTLSIDMVGQADSGRWERRPWPTLSGPAT